jgi:hypothetical protein
VFNKRLLLVAAAFALTGCSGLRLRSPIAPVAAPPPTFVPTTSDVRSTRVIDVRDSSVKAVMFREATDLLKKLYSVDVSDENAGFIMTPWQAGTTPDGAPDVRYRTRVIIRFLGEQWKQVSVRAEANWQRVPDEWDLGFDARVLDTIVNELRSRIGKR